MARNEFFSTREGNFRILVEQSIDGKPVDWFLVERSSLLEREGITVHQKAVEKFVGREVEFLTSTGTGYGYVFRVKRQSEPQK